MGEEEERQREGWKERKKRQGEKEETGRGGDTEEKKGMEREVGVRRRETEKKNR